ncbi:MAG: hypothetical protein B7Z80_02930 [Rhodospirillales bacterium 20-64-7]|nr:MAG: hypothetical protein B7Z80_02930 [Rhodospirillales bacterium 20-64-7]
MQTRNITSMALTWTALFGIYLLLTGEAATDEIIAAAAAAAAGSALSVAVRAGSGHTFRLAPAVWLPPVGRALAALPREVGTVGWHLLKPCLSAGRMETPALLKAAGSDPATNRAVQVLAASLAPNRFVVSLVQSERMLTHRLAGPSTSDAPR